MDFLAGILSKFLLGFVQMFTRDRQNQALGAAEQREKNDEAERKERDKWAKIDSTSSSSESNYKRLSGFGRKRTGHDSS